jgi:hypothetical protein
MLCTDWLACTWSSNSCVALSGHATTVGQCKLAMSKALLGGMTPVAQAPGEKLKLQSGTSVHMHG